MSLADTCIRELDSAIACVGEAITLQKITVDANGAEIVGQTVSCKANVRASIPQDLESADATDIDVVVSPTGLGVFGVPGRDDRLILGASGMVCNMLDIKPIWVQGVLVRVDLKCRG